MFATSKYSAKSMYVYKHTSMCFYIYMCINAEIGNGKMLTIEKWINLDREYRNISYIILGDFL